MTFENTANLAADGDFSSRLGACVMTEALGKTGDTLAEKVVGNQLFWGAAIFIGPVAAAPGFGDTYATGGQAAILDPDILAAVQADWDRIKAIHGGA